MGAYGLPALAIHAPEQPDLLGQIGKITQLKSLLQGQQLQQGQLQMQQQQIKDQQAMTAAMHDWDGKDMQQLPILMKNKGASATAVIGMQTHILGQKEQLSNIAAKDAESGSKNVEALAKRNDIALGHVNTLDNLPDQQLAPTLTQIAQSGELDPQHAQAALQLAQQSPEQIRAQLPIYKKTLMGAKEQFDQTQKQIEDARAKAEQDAKLPGEEAESTAKVAIAFKV